MGALTGGTVFLASRADPLGSGRPAWPLFVILVLYFGVVLGFFVQAVQALWPRKAQRQGSSVGRTPERLPLSMREVEDIVAESPRAYREAWEEVDFGRLTGDLTRRLHEMATINRAKYRALDRLYLGLLVVTALSAVVILAIIALRLG